MVVRDVNFDLRTELKNILMRHEGPQRAITAGELARMLGYKNDRIIRLAIRQLIKGDGDGNAHRFVNGEFTWLLYHHQQTTSR